MPRRQPIQLAPSVLAWARKRAGYKDIRDLAAKLAGGTNEAKINTWERKVEEWERSGQLTFASAEALARVTHTPTGYLLLPEPPVEKLPIRDFRVVGGKTPQVSPDLIDVINDALRRQDWYRDYLLSIGEEPRKFVGSLKMTKDIKAAAEQIRTVISWDVGSRAQMPTWEAALAKQIEEAEDIGIIVMRSGVVGSNTHRPLSVSEFRGFALADDYAPAVFINGTDAKAAQMFTLAHELVHIWLGVSGIFNLNQTYPPPDADAVETFCSKVAAELLVPEADIAVQWANCSDRPDWMRCLTRRFKVSSLVVLRRLRDLEYIDNTEFQQLYTDHLAQIEPKRKSKGGSPYRNIQARLGQRLTLALLESTLEGHTLYRDAFRLLGVNRVDTLHELARRMGAMV